MKIAILHRYPLTIIEGTNPALIEFLNLLKQRGHKIQLVTFYQFNRRNKLSSILRSLWFTFITPIKVWALHKHHNFDIIYCDDSWPLYPLIIKKLTRAKVYIRRGDLMWTYFPFWIRWLIKKWEIPTLKQADKISVITQEFKDYLVRQNINPAKITVIEDSINFDWFRTMNPSFDERFTIGYHGLNLPIKDIPVLLKAVELVRQSYDIRFIFLSNHKKADCWVPYEEIPFWIDNVDIGVVTRKKLLANQLIVSTSLLQYWAISKPVIAPRLPAISTVVKEGVNGWLYEPGNFVDLSLKIIKAIKNRDRLKEMGQKACRMARRQFDQHLIGQKMYEFIHS